MKKLIITLLVIGLLFAFVGQGFAFNLDAVVNSDGQALWGQMHTEDFTKGILEWMIDLTMWLFDCNQGQAIKILKTFVY